MQQIFNKLNFLVGNEKVLTEIKNVPALPIFCEGVTNFLAELSNEILKDNRSRKSSDLTAYAYWIRKASLMKEKNLRGEMISSRLGRGIAFHIAPSNVPLAFAMSLTASLLSGNANIVRISSRDFFEIEIVCDALNKLLAENESMQKYICLVRYPHDEEITKTFSEICDLRIIWGGDNTINTIRKIPIPPRAVELTFADRHSIALIDSEKYLQENPADIAKKFFYDTYVTDQNACSSPRIIIWFGEKISEAQEKFWSALNIAVRKNYEMQPIQAVDKLSAACLLAMKNSDIKILSDDNFAMRILTKNLSADLMENKVGGGYFFEYCAKNIEEIFPILNKSCQTLAVLGLDKKMLREKIISAGLRGVDRIVDFGETNRLELIWDGFDLIREMSRTIDL